MKPNRIYFLGNPYPNGHEIVKFIWSGRIDEDENLWFDFHLETDAYYAEDESEDEEEPESSWQAKSVWGNYHRCKISSTFWEEENKGIQIDTAGKKFNFTAYLKNELTVDSLPLADDFDYEDLAFNLYLLGHDSCANHKLKFTENNGGYNIEWTGKIALTYAGDDSFDYDFIVQIEQAQFAGFHYPKQWSLEKAKEILEKKLDDFDSYEFVDLNPKSNKREYKLMKIAK